MKFKQRNVRCLSVEVDIKLFSEDDCTLSVLVNSYQRQSKKQYVFCNLRNHRCSGVTEKGKERKEILRQNKNCFECFYFGNVAKKL